MKYRKSIFAAITLLVMFALNLPVFAQKATNFTESKTSQSKTYVWIVYTFDFPCPQTNRNMKRAMYELSWAASTGSKTLVNRSEGCHTFKDHPMYHGLGFVVRIRLNNPLSTLQIGDTENCKAGSIYRKEPPEYTNDKYTQVNLDWK